MGGRAGVYADFAITDHEVHIGAMERRCSWARALLLAGCVCLTVLARADGDGAWSVARFQTAGFAGAVDVATFPLQVAYDPTIIVFPKGYRQNHSFVARGDFDIAEAGSYAFRAVASERDGTVFRIEVDGFAPDEQPSGRVNLKPGTSRIEVFGKKGSTKRYWVDFKVEWRKGDEPWQPLVPRSVSDDAARQPVAAPDITFRWEGGESRYFKFRTYRFDIAEAGPYELRSVLPKLPTVEKFYLDGRQVICWIRPGAEARGNLPTEFFGGLRAVRWLEKGPHVLDVLLDDPGWKLDDVRRMMESGVWRFGLRRLPGKNLQTETFFYPDVGDDAMVFARNRETLRVAARSAVKGFAGRYAMEVRPLRDEQQVVWRQELAVKDGPAWFDYPCDRVGGFDFVIRDDGGRVVEGPWSFAVSDEARDSSAKPARPPIVIDRVDCTGETHEFRDNGTSEVVDSSIGRYRLSGPARSHYVWYRQDPKTSLYLPAPETGDRKGQIRKCAFDWFAYTLKVSHPGRTHVVRCRVPNDVERHVTVLAYDRKTGRSNGWCVRTAQGPACSAFGDLAFPVWPNAEALDVLVVTCTQAQRDGRGAVSEIVLEEYPDGLPPLEPAAGGWDPNRRIGWQGEQGDLWIFQRTMPSLWQGDAVFRQGDDVHGYMNWQDFCDSFDRMGELAAYRGDSEVGMPVCTYGRMFAAGEVGRLYDPGFDVYLQGMERVRLEKTYDRDVFKLALLKAGQYGFKIVFDFFAMGEVHPSEWAAYHGMAGMTNGFLLSARADGAPYRGYHTKAQLMNPAHPVARRHFVRFYEALAERYGRHSAFDGVRQRQWQNLPGTFEPTWFRENLGFDDFTVGRFAEEREIAGLKPVGSDASAFEARRKYIQSHYGREWQSWRTEKCVSLYEEMLAAMRRHAPQLRIVGPPEFPIGHTLNPWVSGTGLDAATFASRPELGYRRGVVNVLAGMVEENRLDAACFARFNIRSGEGANPPDLCQTLRITYPDSVCVDGSYLASPYHLRPLAQALATNNLNQVYAGAGWALPPVDDALRRFARAYRAIPSLDYCRMTLTGCVARTAAVLCGKEKGGALVVYAVNLTDRDRELVLKFDNPFKSAFDLVDGVRVTDGNRVVMQTAAFMPAVWRFVGADAPLEVQIPSSEGDRTYATGLWNRILELERMATPQVREPRWLSGLRNAPPDAGMPEEFALAELLEPMKRLASEGKYRELSVAAEDFNRDHRWWFEAFGWPVDSDPSYIPPKFAPWPAEMVFSGKTPLRVPDMQPPQPSYEVRQFPDIDKERNRRFAVLPEGGSFVIRPNPLFRTPRHIGLVALFGGGFGGYEIRCGGKAVCTIGPGKTEKPRLELRRASLPVPWEDAERHGIEVVAVGGKAALLFVNDFFRRGAR